MGGSSSCLLPSAADLAKSLKEGDEGAMLRNLEASPRLLSCNTSRLSLAATTPLHVACKCKQVEAVKEAISFLSNSPLEVVRKAVQSYCTRMDLPLPTSVREGVRIAVDMANSRGQTPLMYACFAGSPELVKILLLHGADPWVGDSHASRTALHYAAIGGSAACIRELTERVPVGMTSWGAAKYVDVRSDCGLTALHYSAYFGDVAAIRELLRHHPNINAAASKGSGDVHGPCEVGSTALHFAAMRGNIRAAQELMHYYARRTLTNPHSIVDPRNRANARSQLPWQVASAHQPVNRALSALLHPSFRMQEPVREHSAHALLNSNTAGRLASDPLVGPSPLVAIAATALRRKLMDDVSSAARCAEQIAEQQRETLAWRAAQRAAAALTLVPSSSSSSSSSSPSTSRKSLNQQGSSEDDGSDRSSGAGGSGNGSGGVPATHGPTSTTEVIDMAPSEVTLGIRRPGCSSGGGDEIPRGTQCGEGFTGIAREGRPGDADKAEEKEEEEEEDEGLCGVCWVAPRAVAPEGCARGHGVCADCANRLCGHMTTAPLRCPFCRQVVTGFVNRDRLAGKP